MATFNIPAPVSRSVAAIEDFKGVDLNSSPTNVSLTRSPEAPNMIRDVPGKVRKRQGYELTGTYSGRINGVHRLGEKTLIHAGTSLYLNGTVIRSGLADDRSVARQFYGKLFIFDGKKALCYGEFETKSGSTTTKTWKICAIEEEAYIPTIIISRFPSGGGKTLEPINLIGKKFKESFLGTETDKVYQLTTTELSSDAVSVRVLVKEGEWTDKTEGTHFTVNRTAGTVTFTTAPGASPVSGMDNVEITAAKVRDGYADKINKCRIMSLYGVNGSLDRMFVSGNPEFQNYDWYCQMADGFYFGDTWYSVLGQGNSAIVGYSIINDRLAAHKSESEEGRNIILRRGELNGEQASFSIVGTLSGRGALCRHTFEYLGSEPLFLTDLGVMAITAADLTGEKYSQNRSFYINNALLSESNLKDSFAFTWRDFYLLSVGTGRVYILDGLQKTYEKDNPYSNFQYECYYWDNVPARLFWEDSQGRLCFGDANGKTYRFYDDKENQKSYNDLGKAIVARWDIPDLSGKAFYKNKTFRYLSLRLAPAIATGVEVYVEKKGVWSKIYDSGAKAMYFDFTHINWEKINFSTDNTPRTFGQKIKVKKVDKARFSLRNGALNEPFGLYMVAFEFTENEYYRG